MKGIILAGGAGTRLYPLTRVTSKQLLPIYDRPMIFYPLETLVAGGIKDILVITDPQYLTHFVKLLGTGKDWGVRLSYETQEKPEGLAQAFLIGEHFVGTDSVTMILGDNLFVGDDGFLKKSIANFVSGGRIFAKQVKDPQRFGVVSFGRNQKAIKIVEKPTEPESEYAVTGLYVYDNSVIAKAKSLRPSARGELEITDINNLYLAEGKLEVVIYRHYWLDTGTFDALLEASNKIASLKKKK